MQKPEEPQPLDKKQIFLLLFARELIKNSQEAVSQLKRIIEEENGPEEIPHQKEETKEEMPLVKSILSESPSNGGELSVIKPVIIKTQRQEISGSAQKFEYPVLRIPEPKLPPEFQYLKPVPSRREIDLGKLNQIINDPQVKEIECEAPNKPIIVYGTMGKMPTEIILSNNEIEDIIERFSSASKIPVDVGVYKVVVGNLIFSAVISDIVSSKFLITKMAPQTQTIIRNPNQISKGPRQSIDYSAYIRK
jgi:hypothetical protein